MLAAVQARISIAFCDSADFSGDGGVPPEVVYDGAGNNAFALFLGWIFAPICIGIAKLFKPKQAEEGGMN